MVSDSAHPQRPGQRPASSTNRSVRFRIKRQDRPGEGARWEDFVVDVEPGANVIACLQQIARLSKTAEGKARRTVKRF